MFIQKGGVADGKLLLGDKIKSINDITVNDKEVEFDNEVNKINWGDEVTFEVERKNKIQINSASVLNLITPFILNIIISYYY